VLHAWGCAEARLNQKNNPNHPPPSPTKTKPSQHRHSAENSYTHRHLCEFTGLDFEMAIYEHYFEVLGLLVERRVDRLGALRDLRGGAHFLHKQTSSSNLTTQNTHPKTQKQTKRCST
jgi:hypothetical protein